jgi:hypothetical protein
LDNSVHTLAVKFDLFPDEIKLVLKILNRVDQDTFTPEEQSVFEPLLDAFKDFALEYSA